MALIAKDFLLRLEWHGGLFRVSLADLDELQQKLPKT